MDFAPRKCFEIPSATPVHVAPNTYIVTYPCCKYPKTNYAPFLTFGTRKPVKAVSYTEAIYDPPAIRSKIKYGNSLQFTAPRVTMDIKGEEPPNEKYSRKPYIRTAKKKGNAGRLIVCRVPFSRGVSVPTIPGRKDVNGYDITEDDELVKLPPPDHDNTLGPAFYSVPSGELNFNSKRYKGCNWSKFRGKRTKFAIDGNPGPGEYDVKFVTCPHPHESEKFRELMRKCCNVPRYTCQLICEATNEGKPGPGYYEVVDLDKVGKPKNLSLKPLTTAQRFVYKVNEGPGPQTYDVCDCFHHRRDTRVKSVPFLNEALRFPQRRVAPMPGPGDYETTDVKCTRCMGKKASFNNTAERKCLEALNNHPGPGEYDLDFARCCPREPENRTSVFSSMTCRFKRKKELCEPDPASYNITDSFKHISDKKSFAKGKHIPFSTSEKKFALMAGTLVGYDSPAVGEYDLLLPKGNGKTIPIADRFQSGGREKRPGPLTYTLHPSCGLAVYRGTFTHNRRLMKEVYKKQESLIVPKRSEGKLSSNKRSSLDSDSSDGSTTINPRKIRYRSMDVDFMGASGLISPRKNFKGAKQTFALAQQ